MITFVKTQMGRYVQLTRLRDSDLITSVIGCRISHYELRTPSNKSFLNHTLTIL